jgi:hypothetical protein
MKLRLDGTFPSICSLEVAGEAFTLVTATD